MCSMKAAPVQNKKKLPVRLNTSVATSTILQQPLVSLRSQASAGTVHIFHMVFKNDMGLSVNRVLQHPTVSPHQSCHENPNIFVG